MAYFLKKTKNKKGLYLQIYESFYDPERGHTAHKSYKPIGYVHELQAKGIDDPISHFKEEVNQLNQDFQTTKNAKKALQISDESPEKLIGYFPLKREYPKVCVNLQTGVRYNYSVWRFLLWQEENVTHHRKQQCAK